MIYLDGRPDTPAAVADRQSVTGLIRARLRGRLDRRQLIARAALLGIPAPVLAIILHATGDDRPAPAAASWQTIGTPAASPLAAGAPVTLDAPAAPPGEPRAGGTLTIAATAEPLTLHPWLASSGVSFDLLSGIMDGLFAYNSEQRLQAALAEAFEISDDGLTYGFALRPDVVFHNGEPFTARDVITAWETKLDPAFGAYTVLGWDKIATIDAPDDATLIIQTTEPYAPFLSTVATTLICPTSALADGVVAFRERFATQPIGTGPFRFVEWAPGTRIVLERFAEYRDEPAILDQVIYRVVPDPAAQLAALTTGEAQVTGGASGLPVAAVDTALATPGLIVYEHPTQNWQHIDLKQVDFLRESPVRRALDFATPRQRIIDELLGGRALIAVADQAPGSWAFNDTLEPRPYDLEQAARLLTEAGLRRGANGVWQRDGVPFVIELWGVEGDPLATAIIELVAASWNELGVYTLPRFAGAGVLWGPMGYQFTDQMTACVFTWTNGNDPDDIFYWHSSQIPTSPTASGGNLPAYFHPYEFQDEVDELTSAAVRTLDLEERRALYWDIQDLLAFEVPVIFLYWEQAFPVTAANLGGFYPGAYTNLLWNAQTWYVTDTPTAGA